MKKVSNQILRNSELSIGKLFRSSLGCLLFLKFGLRTAVAVCSWPITCCVFVYRYLFCCLAAQLSCCLAAQLSCCRQPNFLVAWQPSYIVAWQPNYLAAGSPIILLPGSPFILLSRSPRQWNCDRLFQAGRVFHGRKSVGHLFCVCLQVVFVT